MPGRLAYSIAGYRNKLRTTRNGVLLVEGSQDKQAFQLLIAEAEERGWRAPNDLTIDSAESILSRADNVPSNRERVERVFADFDTSSLTVRVVGFVDREYRDFDVSPLYDRHANSHHLIGRVVWSRGHSLENYFFEPDIMSRAIRAVAMTDSYNAAIRAFETAFDSLVRLACAAGLAALEQGRLQMLPATIDSDVIVITDQEADIAIDIWRGRIANQGGSDGTGADAMALPRPNRVSSPVGVLRAVRHACRRRSHRAESSLSGTTRYLD
jgi:Protein of unknown function (DUF4435)